MTRFRSLLLPFLFCAAVAVSLSGCLKDEAQKLPDVGTLQEQARIKLQALAPLRKRAEQNDLQAQFDLGLIYYEGKVIPADHVDAYVWMAMALVQGFKGAEQPVRALSRSLDNMNMLGKAEAKAHVYYARYVTKKMRSYNPASEFIVEINGVPYTQAAALEPVHPIMTVFRHPNPAVTNVEMRHPDNPAMQQVFAVNTPIRLSNHEQHMTLGNLSTSEFVALGEGGEELDTVTIAFMP